MTLAKEINSTHNEKAMKPHVTINWSQDSTISLVTRKGVDNWPLIPGSGRDFTLCHSIQTNYGAYKASCSMATYVCGT
jgi:hypothetical protein